MRGARAIVAKNTKMLVVTATSVQSHTVRGSLTSPATCLPCMRASDEILRKVVTPGFAARGFLPFGLLLAGGGRKGDGADPQHHQERTSDYLHIGGAALPRKSPKTKIPHSSPQS